MKKFENSTKCPRCGEETDHFLSMGGNNLACDCSKCLIEQRGKYEPMGEPHEFITDEMRADRYKYRNDMIQPYREGQLSQEFVHTYPDQTKKMIESGTITRQQADNAKPVWRGDL